MQVKNFENNGKSISKNILKLNLEQNINLSCIIIWSTYVQRKPIFDSFMIRLPDKSEKSLWHNSQLRVIMSQLDMLSQLDLYLAITRVIHMDDLKFISAFNPCEIDLMTTRNIWKLSGKKSPQSGFVALRQLNPIDEKVPYKIFFYIYIYSLRSWNNRSYAFLVRHLFSILASKEIWVLAFDYFLRNFIKLVTVILGM